MSSRLALVLFSGGQDSTTCLAWALANYDSVETIGFDYGQRHRIELDCRTNVLSALKADFPSWRSRLGEDILINVPSLKALGATAMTHDVTIQMQASGLPNTFVPGRNLIFLTLAAAHAYRRGIDTLVGGMCETDYSGYPDCRSNTLRALEKSLTLGMDQDVTIATPLMQKDKAQTWSMAHQLGGNSLIELIIEKTHTCYIGDRTTRHIWGYGCGTCPACQLRANGFTQWRTPQ